MRYPQPLKNYTVVIESDRPGGGRIRIKRKILVENESEGLRLIIDRYGIGKNANIYIREKV